MLLSNFSKLHALHDLHLLYEVITPRGGQIEKIRKKLR
jgi:hypothetical protein